MPVYVDHMMACVPNQRWRWSSSCHLFADTLDELHAFAARLGLSHSWFQRTSVPHYDLTQSMRDRAVAMGAMELSSRDAVAVWRQSRADAATGGSHGR